MDKPRPPGRLVKWSQLPDHISTREVARVFGVDERSVRRWYAEGRIPRSAKVELPGRQVYWHRDDIRKMHEALATDREAGA